ncbi:MAG: hypothetical protein K2P98_05700 [Neisseriaceae bacterium]|nr:hypothetical protein [Neisseriaceae bacterium]
MIHTSAVISEKAVLGKNNMRRLDGLTILRFFAAFWVFIFHLNMRIPLGLPVKLTSIISSGAVAMPVFYAVWLCSGLQLF